MSIVIAIAAPHVAAAASTGTPVWVTISVSAVGGGVIASLVSTYLTTGREGRQARAKVRELLFETEDTRWTDTDYKLFRQALSRLEAAALIARAPRKIVARYSYLANVAHYTQLAKEKANPGYPPRGLPYDLAALVDLTIGVLIEHLWHPVSKKRHVKRGIWLIDRAIERTKEKHPDFAWNVQIFTSRTVTREPGLRGVIHRFAARVSRLWKRLRSWVNS